ncbi:unnamed protein product, partial [marine sediment metagenome]
RFLKLKKDSNFTLSIVIPLYNEEKSIRNILNLIPHNDGIEIIVVDDGSTDKSFQEAIESDKSIKLIKLDENQGYGNAILTGVKNASGDIIITMDSDGQHNPNEICRLIEPILNDKADICIGSRYLGQCNYNIPLHTRVGECIIEKTLRLFFRQKVCNNQSGYRALKREAVSIFDDIKFNGFTSATEVLIKSKLKGYRVKEVPIVLEPRKYGMSKIKLVKLVITLISCFGYYFFIKLKNLILKNR